jgi:hypothetical protein
MSCVTQDFSVCLFGSAKSYFFFYGAFTGSLSFIIRIFVTHFYVSVKENIKHEYLRRFVLWLRTTWRSYMKSWRWLYVFSEWRWIIRHITLRIIPYELCPVSKFSSVIQNWIWWLILIGGLPCTFSPSMYEPTHWIRLPYTWNSVVL